ncbi:MULTISPECIES: hypothetical protein [Cupriavidus]
MSAIRTRADYRRMRARWRRLLHRARACASLDLMEAGAAYLACAERIEQSYPFLQLARLAARQDPLLLPVRCRLDAWRTDLDILF